MLAFELPCQFYVISVCCLPPEEYPMCAKNRLLHKPVLFGFQRREVQINACKNPQGNVQVTVTQNAVTQVDVSFKQRSFGLSSWAISLVEKQTWICSPACRCILCFASELAVGVLQFQSKLDQEPRNE